MKTLIQRSLAALTCLALTLMMGCRYQIPLVNEPTTIDPLVLGSWSRTDKPEHVQVIRLSDHDYLINYYGDETVLYFRGYPIRFGEALYVQIQFIATSDEILDDKRRRFDVLRYELNGDSAVVSLLNEELISSDVSDPQEFQSLVRRHQERDDLFRKLAVFKREAQ